MDFQNMYQYIVLKRKDLGAGAQEKQDDLSGKKTEEKLKNFRGVPLDFIMFSVKILTELKKFQFRTYDS